MAYVRQAVVIVHGMGEQRPLETLTGFIDTALAPDADGRREYFSRPETVTGSYESRRFLAPRSPRTGEPEQHAQTEFFEYHWSYLMQGNRLDDLWPTFRRMLLLPWWRVPQGLKVVWLLAWAGIAWVVYAFVWGPWSDLPSEEGDLVPRLVAAVLSGGVAVAVVSYLVGRALPGWLTTSFVDVVRYLDTSPRSYAQRRDIRAGLVTLLQRLHDSGRYDRVVVVAHSLGGFIAYDAVTFLWGQMNARHAGLRAPATFAGLEELERTASALPDPACGRRGGGQGQADPADVEAYRVAQRTAWRGLREQGNPWLITDLVTFGTPMAFADRLLAGRGAISFAARVARRELPTCPPQNEEKASNNIHRTARFFSWPKTVVERRKGHRTPVTRRVLYAGAPFAVVRWTNLWFPARLGFFGDWFGGPLAPLFGNGILDVPVLGNVLFDPGTNLWRNRLVPAAAHAYYVEFPEDTRDDAIATHLRRALDLASSGWVPSRP